LGDPRRGLPPEAPGRESLGGEPAAFALSRYRPVRAGDGPPGRLTDLREPCAILGARRPPNHLVAALLDRPRRGRGRGPAGVSVPAAEVRVRVRAVAARNGNVELRVAPHAVFGDVEA